MSHLHKYVVLAAADVTSQRVADCVQTSEATVRYSLDGSQGILKYLDPAPASMVGFATLTHAEVLATVAGSAWQTPESG